MQLFIQEEIHIKHYSPSVLNKNIENYDIQDMLTHQESKIGGRVP